MSRALKAFPVSEAMAVRSSEAHDIFCRRMRGEKG
jgi:hypothetical protein